MKNGVKYYSQNGEDYLLWNFFKYKKKGFFVDIGAFDGIHLSNSYSFEKEGWDGICVEANPVIFNKLKKNRPRSGSFNYAMVGEGKGEIDFFVEEMGQLSTTIGASEKMNDIIERYNKRNINFSGIRKISVESISLDALMRKYFPSIHDIDFITIDTEGNEYDILNGIDFSKYNIGLILVEANSEETEEKLSRLLTKNNFIYSRKVGSNLFFVKTVPEAEKLRSIKVKCFIEKQEHPAGEIFTPRKYRKRFEIK